MKDGQYTICLSADGYDGEGSLQLKKNHGRGRDRSYEIELQFQGEGARCAGIVNILMSPEIVHNSRMPKHYSLTMTGTGMEDQFNLIGVGPLGIIVVLSGEWKRGLFEDNPP